MNKAQKIVQVDGKGPRWQVKSWRTKMYKVDKICDSLTPTTPLARAHVRHIVREKEWFREWNEQYLEEIE
jgi:hypothetical protein